MLCDMKRFETFMVKTKSYGSRETNKGGGIKLNIIIRIKLIIYLTTLNIQDGKKI